MILTCKFCKGKFEGSARRRYCSPRCKKNFENSLRSSRKAGRGSDSLEIPLVTRRPRRLNEMAAAFWDKVSPTVISRGHLNVLCEDAFAELCDLHSRLVDINRAIDNERAPKDEGKSLIHEGNESAFSDLKRKYSKQFLDYCKEFYLTPRVNRGNFGLKENENGQEEKDELFD